MGEITKCACLVELFGLAVQNSKCWLLRSKTNHEQCISILRFNILYTMRAYVDIDENPMLFKMRKYIYNF